MLFAEAPVLARAVDLIRLDDSRIGSHALAVLLDHVNKRRALVEVIPGQTIKERIALCHAHRDLGSELDSRLGFPAHDRPDMRLMNVDDPVFYLMGSLAPHLKLLTVQFMNHQQVAVGFTAKQRERLRLGLLGDDGEVPSNVSELPPDRFADHFRSRPALLGHHQKLLARFFPVGTRFRRLSDDRFMQRIDDRFKRLWLGRRLLHGRCCF